MSALINWTEIINHDMFDFVMDVKKWKMDIITWDDIASGHFNLFEEKFTPNQEAKRQLVEQLVDGNKYDLAKADFDDYDAEFKDENWMCNKCSSIHPDSEMTVDGNRVYCDVCVLDGEGKFTDEQIKEIEKRNPGYVRHEGGGKRTK